MPPSSKSNSRENTCSNKAVGHKCLEENIVKFWNFSCFLQSEDSYFTLATFYYCTMAWQKLKGSLAFLVDHKKDFFFFLKEH